MSKKAQSRESMIQIRELGITTLLRKLSMQLSNSQDSAEDRATGVLLGGKGEHRGLGRINAGRPQRQGTTYTI